MKVYSVLFESSYENEDVHSSISAFDSREKALACLEKALADEIAEGRYTEDEVADRLVRDGDDRFCFYHDDAKSEWKFRCTVYENEVG